MNQIIIRVVGGFLASFFLVANCFAFKVDTHVWVAQQVLNDLQDGKLTFSVDGSAIVIVPPASAVNALKNNPGAYRSGSLGPDAYPDILVGQTIVHPGAPNINGGWKTDQWLKQVLEDAQSSGNGTQLAFAYGYLSHAAADVWAHTYVNEYAGDIFSMLDGELTVERRHVLLESLISKSTPVLKDQNNAVVGNYYDPAIYAADNSAVRNALIYNPNVASQYWLQTTGNHLALISKLRGKLVKIEDHLNRPNFYLTTEAQQAAEKLGLPTALSNAVGQVANAADQVNNSVNADNLTTLNRQLADKASLILGAGNSYANQSLDAANQVNNATLNLASKLAALDTHLKNVVYTTVEKQVCSWKWKLFTGDFLSCSIVKETYEAQSWIDKKIGLQAQVDATRNALNQSVATLKTVNNALLGAAISEVNRQTSVLNGVLTLYNQNININPLKAAVASWKAGTDEAMADYIRTSGVVIRESIKPNGELLAPLNQWLDCQLPKVTGLPRKGVDLVCQGRNTYNQVMNELNQLTTAIAKVDPGMRLYLELKAEVEQSLRDAVDSQLRNAAEQIVGKEAVAFINSLKEEPTDAALRAAFTSPANKNLMLIPDAYTRARAEMYLQSDGKFDPIRFAPAYNAVVMAKLSLLDNAGQNELAKKLVAFSNWKSNAGCYPGGYCPFSSFDYAMSVGWQTITFPSGNLCFENNILFSAVKSIDGDHQWREFAPPYPRQGSFDLAKAVTDRNYGYGASDGVNKGFCYWRADARTPVFRKLFKGPLIAGLENPSAFNLPSLLSVTYPYSLVLPAGTGFSASLNSFPDKCQTTKFIGYAGPGSFLWETSKDYCDKFSTAGGVIVVY